VRKIEMERIIRFFMEDIVSFVQVLNVWMAIELTRKEGSTTGFIRI